MLNVLTTQFDDLAAFVTEANDDMTRQSLFVQGSPVNGWLRVWIMVDSGASRSAAPPTMAPSVPIQASEASTAGVKFKTASGQEIPAQGERRLRLADVNGNEFRLRFEICDVRRPLLSVSALADCGHVSVFEKKGGYIRLRRGGKMKMIRRGGVYFLPLWLAPNQGGAAEVRTQTLAAMEENEEMRGDERKKHEDEEESTKKTMRRGQKTFDGWMTSDGFRCRR